MYAAAIKKKYARFTEEAHSLEHYREKVNGLTGCSEYSKFERVTNPLFRIKIS